MRVVCVASCALVATALIQAQTTITLKQVPNNAPAELLSTAELEALRDPFFEVVLRDHADVVTLRGVEELLLVPGVTRHVFVVDENLRNPARQQSRRSVIAYRGNHPQGGQLAPNVMLSVFFTSEDFPDAPPSIEAWGWDAHRGRYNYYKMDNTGNPLLRATWKFRGSSDDADLLNEVERRGTCFECHVNGAPLMKELPIPWNNWHSFEGPVTYLQKGAPGAWPVANSERLQNLSGAEDLETQFIAPAITQFNTRRINRGLERREDTGDIRVDANGLGRVVEARRLLRSLFETTEVNFTSSRQKSGMHPLDPKASGQPNQDTVLPNSLFLNAGLIGGNGILDVTGLEIAQANQFSALRATPAQYRTAVEALGLRLAGRPGDADFAWFIPEASHLDNSMVDRLIRRGILSRQFVASVAAIDLERPILSANRARLLSFVPDTFQFVAASGKGSASHPDSLTRAVIENLRAAKPVPGSSESEFLVMLESKDPVSELRARVDAYHKRMIADSKTPDFVVRMMRRAVELRRAVLDDPVLSALDETGDRLMPVP